MSGVTPVAQYAATNFTADTAITYKTKIDANSVAAQRIVSRFAPHAQTSPNMTVALDAGNLFDGVTLTEVAAQNTATLTAPVSHPRIDRVVIDNITGVVSVVAGTQAVSPVAPAIPNGKSPVAQVLFQTTTTSITNAIITDERNFSGLSVGGFGAQTNIGSASSCDIGTVLSRNAKITGMTSIASFGSSANTQAPIYLVEFAAALTLTNGAALLLPGNANIVTAAGDTAVAEYLGSGNWKIRDYCLASGASLFDFVPDTGSGGAPGLVPAPSAGDAAAGKVLGAGGAFVSPPSAIKAWANFDGTGSVTINASFNIDSIVRNGAGDYTINFTNAMADANYVLTGTSKAQSNVVDIVCENNNSPTRSTTALRIYVYNASTGNVNDSNKINIAIIGN